MKYTAVLILSFLFAGCGGNLSDEQRRKIREGMEEQKIIQVSDSEIMSVSLERAQKIYGALEKQSFTAGAVDSLEQSYKADINWVVPGRENARAIEKQLIEAYILGATEGKTAENLQKLWKSEDRKDYDSLLYSRPVFTRFADGSEQLDGIWNVTMARKDVVLEIGRTRR